MDTNNMIIPPLPNRRQKNFGKKIILLGLQCAFLMIGALIIWCLTYSRNERNNDVSREIAENWGNVVYIDGPVVVVSNDSAMNIYPKRIIYDTKVETETLHRNIYESEVFNAHVFSSGSFDKVSLSEDTVYLKLYVNTQQIYNLRPLKIADQTEEWSCFENYISAPIPVVKLVEEIDFDVEFDIRGSSGIYINQTGGNSTITISGDASNPSFAGNILPEKRIIDGRLFNARWISNVAKSFFVEDENYNYVGVNFLLGVDRYRKVSRSLKYAFIIILLTYVSVLLTETFLKRDIPKFNYFLIGVSLILFYSLLLAFVEHISFAMAYLLSSLLTVALIGGYMWRMLDSRKVGVTISVILIALYVICFIMLSLSTYALLMGSLLLFVTLAIMMYATLLLNNSK